MRSAIRALTSASSAALASASVSSLGSSALNARHTPWCPPEPRRITGKAATVAALGTLADLALPDDLRARLEAAGWKVESLKSRKLPGWTQWDGAAVRGDAFAFVRAMEVGKTPPEGGLQDVAPQSWARHDDGGRVLLVGALDPERADAQLDELLEVLEADRATQRSINRWLRDLGFSSVEVEAVERDGVRELSGSARLGPLDVRVQVERPTAAKRPSEKWKRSRNSGSAFALAGPWKVSVTVTSPAKGQALLDALLA